jgi:Domain of unknown function (DUF5655)
MKSKKKVGDQKSWCATESALTHDLGDQNFYASGKALMFSKEICYFFVRPKKSYLEVVVFLKSKETIAGFKPAKIVSKTKYAHHFKLIHSDQVEGSLTDSIQQAFKTCRR